MIQTRKDLKEYLQADYKVSNIKHKWFERFSWGENYHVYKYIKHLRYLEFYTNKKKYPWDYILYCFFYLLHRRDILSYGIFLKPNTVGKGLSLVHPGFRRIGANIHIGENCTILPGVLMGKKLPGIKLVGFEIGDNCYISTGVTILGPIKIGNNVTIAAGAVVNKDIPDNAVVAGVPAKIIKIKENPSI